MMQTDRTEATLRTRSVPKIATTKMNTPYEKGTQQIGQTRQLAESGAPCGKGYRRRHAHHAQVQQLKEIGEDGGVSAVKGVVVGAVIIGLVLSGKPQAVSEKHAVIGHGQHRHENAPGAIPDKIAVNLGAGSEAAAKVSGEPHKGHAQSDGSCFRLFHRWLTALSSRTFMACSSMGRVTL